MREHWGLLIVLATALGIRLWLLKWWNPFPFGDVFNYVTIAQNLSHGFYPIAEKRLPFYPLLILLVHTLAPFLSWEGVAIGIAMAASLVALALLYAIGRHLGLKKVPILVGLLFLMSYQPYLAYSIRGYADSTFIALFLASLLLVLRARKHNVAITAGIVFAALALTRYEGVIAAAVFGLLYIWQICLTGRQARWRQTGILIAVGLLVVTPYIGIAVRSGRSLLPTAYLTQDAEGNQGYGASSWHEFTDNYYAIWERVGLFALWTVPQYLWHQAQEDLIGWHQYVVSEVVEPRKAAALLALAGLIYLVARRRWQLLVILLLPFLAISAAAAWWAPLIRYDAMFFPLIVLLAAIGLHAIAAVYQKSLAPNAWGKYVYRLGALLLLFTGSAVWMLNLTQDTYYSLRKSRFRELAFYQAIKTIRFVPQVVAFDNSKAIAIVYLGARALDAEHLFPKEAAPKQRWQILIYRQVAYVLTADTPKSPFTFLKQPPPGVTVTKQSSFSVEQGNNNIDTAAVYHLEYTQ